MFNEQSPKGEWQQSEAAKAKGVCHTTEECLAMYAALSEELKLPALRMLRADQEGERAQILASIAADPEGWYGPYHFSRGMGIRNLLRQRGFGEEYFGVHNLDDIYIPLVTESLIREDL